MPRYTRTIYRGPVSPPSYSAWSPGYLCVDFLRQRCRTQVIDSEVRILDWGRALLSVKHAPWISVVVDIWHAHVLAFALFAIFLLLSRLRSITLLARAHLFQNKSSSFFPPRIIVTHQLEGVFLTSPQICWAKSKHAIRYCFLPLDKRAVVW